MDTFATIVRYGFLVALAVQALLIGRAFLAMLREKALAPRAAEGSADGAAPAEE